MANSLISLIRFTQCSLFRSALKPNHLNIGLPCVSKIQVKTLYAKQTLGLEGFQQNQQRTRASLANIQEKFKTKMQEFAGDDSKHMIFTEDLKNMIHIAESDDDIDLVVKMIKRFNKQNDSLRFGNYVFGPVVMRLFYITNKPEVAVECFKDPDLTGFFDQIMTYQILLDLLYENQKYKEILQVVNIIKERQIEGAKYPRNVVVLAMAACFKMNNKESYEYAKNLWEQIKSVGQFPMRRAITFFAGLALNQGDPTTAMEIVSSARNQNYTTVRNIKVAALADLGRAEDAIPILKSILMEDVPDKTLQTFNKDVLERFKKSIENSDNKELILEYNRLEAIFQKEGHISDMTLNDQLCVEIKSPPVLNNRMGARTTRFQRNVPEYKNKHFEYRQRPGLKDLV